MRVQTSLLFCSGDKSVRIMSFEEIISEIQNKPEIWLSSHSLNNNKIVKARVWRELSEKLGIEGTL